MVRCMQRDKRRKDKSPNPNPNPINNRNESVTCAIIVAGTPVHHYGTEALRLRVGKTTDAIIESIYVTIHILL